MPIKQIPAKVVYECDCCGDQRESVASKVMPEGVAPEGWGRFKFMEIGRDAQGHAVGGSRCDFNLCQPCCVALMEAMP